MMVEYKGVPVVWETPRFVVITGALTDDVVYQYIIYNKEHGVPEAWHTTLLFVKEWCKAMEKALNDFDSPPEDMSIHIMNSPFGKN